MSYVNVLMYSSALPTYRRRKDDEGVIRADDRSNRDRVSDFLNNID